VAIPPRQNTSHALHRDLNDHDRLTVFRCPALHYRRPSRDNPVLGMSKLTDAYIIGVPPGQALQACRDAVGRCGWQLESELPGAFEIIVPLTLASSPSRIRIGLSGAPAPGQTTVSLTGRMGGSRAKPELREQFNHFRNMLERPVPVGATVPLWSGAAAAPATDARREADASATNALGGTPSPADALLRRPGPGLQADGTWRAIPDEPRSPWSFPLTYLVLGIAMTVALAVVLIVTMNRTQGVLGGLQPNLARAFQQVQSELQQPSSSIAPYSYAYPGSGGYTSTTGYPAPGTATASPPGASTTHGP
jgi:hypothetical protein